MFVEALPSEVYLLLQARAHTLSRDLGNIVVNARSMVLYHVSCASRDNYVLCVMAMEFDLHTPTTQRYEGTNFTGATPAQAGLAIESWNNRSLGILIRALAFSDGMTILYKPQFIKD